MTPPRLVVLVSGRGRNLQALIERQRAGLIPARIAAVVSNRADAAALGIAAEAGIATQVVPHAGFAERADFDRALAAVLREQQPDIVALAGFMRVLGDAFVREFEGRMLNVHPSLLPLHPGLDTHGAVLRAGEAEHGATVHFVIPEVDRGARVIQGRLSVRPEDDAQSLAMRVLEQIELKIYPQALAWMARGELALAGGAVVWRGRRLRQPLTMDDLEDPFK
ncbi:MAG: phosphoribosylglycinamide formyltransferase [Nevskia sp.]|nr:phosphoribosylglycinamide formyltransferase [Nevskia sp.]